MPSSPPGYRIKNILSRGIDFFIRTNYTTGRMYKDSTSPGKGLEAMYSLLVKGLPVVFIVSLFGLGWAFSKVYSNNQLRPPTPVLLPTATPTLPIIAVSGSIGPSIQNANTIFRAEGNSNVGKCEILSEDGSTFTIKTTDPDEMAKDICKEVAPAVADDCANNWIDVRDGEMYFTTTVKDEVRVTYNDTVAEEVFFNAVINACNN